MDGRRSLSPHQVHQARKQVSHSALPLKLFHGIRIFAAITAKARPFFVGAWGTGGKINSSEVRMANPSQDSISYYREREQHEIRLALNASSQDIRNIHLEMAECYRVMVEKLEEALVAERDLHRFSAQPSARVQ